MRLPAKREKVLPTLPVCLILLVSNASIMHTIATLVHTLAATVHSEYAEVFDFPDSNTPKLSPPKLPTRNRPHSAKTSNASLPSTEQSPYIAPITHHQILLKPESSTSTEVIHSAPVAVTTNNDSIIEIDVHSSNALIGSTVNKQEWKETEQVSAFKKDSLSSSPATYLLQQQEQGVMSPQVNQYDDPWKPILKPHPKSQKSDNRGKSVEADAPTRKLALTHKLSADTTLSSHHNPHPSPLPLKDHFENTKTSEHFSPSPTNEVQIDSNKEIHTGLQQTASLHKTFKTIEKKKPSSLSGNLLQIALEEKLLCDGIDITSQPYSSQVSNAISHYKLSNNSSR